MAERIVGLALRPRRSARVGALHALALPYAIAPDAAGRLVALLGGRFLFGTRGTGLRRRPFRDGRGQGEGPR